MELNCKRCDRTDVVALEHNSADGSNWLKYAQDQYMKRLHEISVKTLVSNTCDEIIFSLQNHYQGIKTKNKLNLSRNANPR